MKKGTDNFAYWAPRILSILFLLFLAMFSLDVFDENLGFWGTLAGLLVHNIPALVLLIALMISWRYEIVGAVAFILAGLLYIALVLRAFLTEIPYRWYMLSGSLTIAGPAFLIGALFLIGWLKKRDVRSRKSSRR